VTLTARDGQTSLKQDGLRRAGEDSKEYIGHKKLEYKRNWIQHVNRMPRDRLPRIMKHYSQNCQKELPRIMKHIPKTGRRNYPG
jgi:hypothetical protein